MFYKYLLFLYKYMLINLFFSFFFFLAFHSIDLQLALPRLLQAIVTLVFSGPSACSLQSVLKQEFEREGRMVDTDCTRG